MFKKVLSLILSVGMSVSLVACGSKEEAPKEVNSKQVETQPAQQANTNEVKKNKLDSLKEEFKKAGFEVGENQTIAFEIINATNGYKFTLNGQLIEIYEYDQSKLSEEGKKTTEQAKKGSISMSGFNVPVKYKDGIMLIRYDEHKDKDKILEVFNSFK